VNKLLQPVADNSKFH